MHMHLTQILDLISNKPLKSEEYQALFLPSCKSNMCPFDFIQTVTFLAIGYVHLNR